MNFLLDANMPYSSLELFKNSGLKAVHVSDIGLGGASDEVIMAHATKEKAIMVTRDLDFGTLAVHLKVRSCGVVILRLPFSFTAREINETLRTFLKVVDLKKLQNAVTIVELGRYRIRRL